VTWLVGRVDDATPPLAWTYALCVAPEGRVPEPRCEGAPLLAASGSTPSAMVPIDFVVPQTDAKELIMLAAFCEGGEAKLDPARFEASCGSAATAWLASTTIRLAAAGPNRNPELAPVLLDGAPLEDACTVVPPGSKHSVLLRFRPEDREPAETLIATHVVNGGELERQFSSLDPDEPAPKDVTIPWNAPGDARVVDFYFVLRDGRGGAAFIRRTVCVRP
jgi:hypothetical protein